MTAAPKPIALPDVPAAAVIAGAAHGSASRCPECWKLKPENPDDLHDVVLMRMDWRKAGRPERTHINVPVGQSPMCLECHNTITADWSPKAPSFDEKGNRL